MAEDLYQKNHTLYIVGLISLVVGLTLFIFTLYMLPHLLFGWRYDIPSFIMDWREWIQFRYGIREVAAARLVLVLLFIVSVLCLLVAYFSSNNLDKELITSEVEEIEKPARIKESTKEELSLGLKILLIIISVFILAALFEWLIYTPPPNQISERIEYIPAIHNTVDRS